MKKIIIILGIILVVLIIVTALINRLLTRPQNSSRTSQTPTGVPPGVLQTKTYRPPTANDRFRLNVIKNELPYETLDFRVEYASVEGTLGSPDYIPDRYVIEQHTPEGDSKIDAYFAEKGMPNIDYKNSDLFEFIDLSYRTYEDSLIKDQELEIPAEIYGTDGTDRSVGNKDIELLTDLLKVLLELDSLEVPTEQVQPTSPPTPGAAQETRTALLPNPLPADSERARAVGGYILRYLRKNPQLVQTYKTAAQQAGLPWQLLAAVHYREGMGVDKSLVSGRKIGVREPDIPRSRCRAGRSGPGVPVQLGGGCGFRTVLDSAIYAGSHLKGKVGGNINSFETLVRAASRYNGGGNANCGRGSSYKGCPKAFYGDDDPYAMNLFDNKHEPMFIIYCEDHKANTRGCPKRDKRPGLVSMFKYLFRQATQL